MSEVTTTTKKAKTAKEAPAAPKAVATTTSKTTLHDCILSAFNSICTRNDIPANSIADRAVELGTALHAKLSTIKNV